jgi:regulator of cell morphogenesis and NO signaling
MTITESTSVADIASSFPSSVRVFQRHGIDFCCGGKTSLAVACQEQGLPVADLVRAIEASTRNAEPADRDWNVEPLHVLINYIVATYHLPLREELPRLESMAAKVSRVHGAKASHLTRLDEIVSELSADLQAHMEKEERVLFPAIRAVERGQGQPAVPLAAPIDVMEDEHDHAGALLSELRAITDGYVAPAWACQTFRALYHGLSELEAEMHLHVHLENNILFPRALTLAGLTASNRSQG